MRFGRKAQTFTTFPRVDQAEEQRHKPSRRRLCRKCCVRKETHAVILCSEGGDVFPLRTTGETGSRRRLGMMLMK